MRLEQPDIEPYGKKYILLKDYTYEWKKGNMGRKLVIPKGFIFDLASVPRIFWTISGVTPGRLGWAAPLIHDFLYEHRGKLPEGSYFLFMNDKWVSSSIVWTRRSADKMFCRLMREDGISRFKRRMAYRAVRLGGWTYWNT